MGNRQLFLRMLAIFRKEFAVEEQLIRQQLQAGDVAAAAMRAHKLKGAASSVAANDVARLAGTLEAVLQQQGSGSPATLLQELGAALSMLLASLPAEIDAAPSDSSDESLVEGKAPPARDIKALVTALEASDTAALDRFEVLRPALIRHLDSDAAACLANAVDNLLFDEAAAMLQSWYSRELAAM